MLLSTWLREGGREGGRESIIQSTDLCHDNLHSMQLRVAYIREHCESVVIKIPERGREGGEQRVIHILSPDVLTGIQGFLSHPEFQGQCAPNHHHLYVYRRERERERERAKTKE